MDPSIRLDPTAVMGIFVNPKSMQLTSHTIYLHQVESPNVIEKLTFQFLVSFI